MNYLGLITSGSVSENNKLDNHGRVQTQVKKTLLENYAKEVSSVVVVHDNTAQHSRKTATLVARGWKNAKIVPSESKVLIKGYPFSPIEALSLIASQKEHGMVIFVGSDDFIEYTQKEWARSENYKAEIKKPQPNEVVLIIVEEKKHVLLKQGTHAAVAV